MSDIEEPKPGVSRRTVAKAMAWSVPAVALAVPAPAYAASGQPRPGWPSAGLQAPRQQRRQGCAALFAGLPGLDASKAFAIPLLVCNNTGKPSSSSRSITITNSTGLPFDVKGINPPYCTVIPDGECVKVIVYANSDNSAEPGGHTRHNGAVGSRLQRHRPPADRHRGCLRPELPAVLEPARRSRRALPPATRRSTSSRPDRGFDEAGCAAAHPASRCAVPRSQHAHMAGTACLTTIAPCRSWSCAREDGHPRHHPRRPLLAAHGFCDPDGRARPGDRGGTRCRPGPPRRRPRRVDDAPALRQRRDDRVRARAVAEPERSRPSTALRARLGATRTATRRFYAPVADAIRRREPSIVLAHNAPVLPQLLRDTPHRVVLYAHNDVLRTYSRAEAHRALDGVAAIVAVGESLAERTRAALPRTWRSGCGSCATASTASCSRRRRRRRPTRRECSAPAFWSSTNPERSGSCSSAG